MKNIIFFTKSLPLFNIFKDIAEKVDPSVRIVHASKINKLENILKSFDPQTIVIDGGSFADFKKENTIPKDVSKYFALIDLSVKNFNNKYKNIGYDFVLKKPVEKQEIENILNKMEDIVFESNNELKLTKDTIVSSKEENVIKDELLIPKTILKKEIHIIPEENNQIDVNNSNSPIFEKSHTSKIFDKKDKSFNQTKKTNQENNPVLNIPKTETMSESKTTPSKNDFKEDVLNSIQSNFNKMNANLADIGLTNLPEIFILPEKEPSEKEKIMKIIKNRNKREDKHMTKTDLDEMLNSLISKNRKVMLEDPVVGLSEDRRYLPAWRKDKVLTLYRISKLNNRGFSSDGIAAKLNEIYKKEIDHFNNLKEIHAKARYIDLTINKESIQIPKKTPIINEINLSSSKQALVDLDEEALEDLAYEKAASVDVDIDSSLENFSLLDESIKAKDIIILNSPKNDLSQKEEDIVLFDESEEDAIVLDAQNRFKELDAAILKKEKINLILPINNELQSEDVLVENQAYKETIADLEAKEANFEKYKDLNDEITKKEKVEYNEVKVENVTELDLERQAQELEEHLFKDQLEEATYRANVTALKPDKDKKTPTTQEIIKEDEPSEEALFKEQLENSTDRANKTALRPEHINDNKNIVDVGNKELSNNRAISEPNINILRQEEDIALIARRRTGKSNEKVLNEYSSMEDVLGDFSSNSESLLSKYRDATRQKLAQERFDEDKANKLREDIPIEPPRDVFARNQAEEHQKKKKIFGLFNKRR